MLNTNKVLLNSFFIVLCCIFSIACSRNKHASKNIFYYNEQTGIQSLDPAFAKNQSVNWATHQVYNTLVEVDDSLQVKPSLAKRWLFSTDRKTITFHLRNDVFFHDSKVFPNGTGRKMIAADVVYSLYRIIDKKVASPGAWIFNGKVDSIIPFKAIDDTTFQLNLTAPFQPILGILTMQYCSVVPKEAVDFFGAQFRANPVGTGPFVFDQWEEGIGLTFTKNKKYFEKDNKGNQLPYLDGISVSFYDSKATEFMLFRKKELDFINDIDPSFKDEILSKRGELRSSWQGKVKLNKSPYLNLEYLGILQDTKNELLINNPLAKKEIRQAINYGFDREKLMLYMRNSIGTAATSGIVPKGLPTFDANAVKGFEYNPEKAKQLLKQANYKGEKIVLNTIAIYQDLAGYIVKELEQIGLNIKLDVIQKSLLLEKTSKSQTAFFRGSWIADYPDAENYLTLFYSKNPAPPNYTRFNNPNYDLLYEKAISETDNKKRNDLYQQMDRMIIDNAVVVPLWYDMVIHLVQPNLSGFTPNALNLLELRYTKKQ